MLSICMFHPSTRSLAAKVFLTALVLLVIFSVPMLEMPKIQSTEHKPLQPGGRFKLYKPAFWGWLDAVGIPYQSPPRRNVGAPGCSKLVALSQQTVIDFEYLFKSLSGVARPMISTRLLLSSQAFRWKWTMTSHFGIQPMTLKVCGCVHLHAAGPSSHSAQVQRLALGHLHLQLGQDPDFWDQGSPGRRGVLKLRKVPYINLYDSIRRHDVTTSPPN